MVGLAKVSRVFLPPHQFTDLIERSPKKAAPSKSFLRQKYVVGGLSSKKIGAQIFCARAIEVKKKAEVIELKNLTERAAIAIRRLPTS